MPNRTVPFRNFGRSQVELIRSANGPLIRNQLRSNGIQPESALVVDGCGIVRTDLSSSVDGSAKEIPPDAWHMGFTLSCVSVWDPSGRVNPDQTGSLTQPQQFTNSVPMALVQHTEWHIAARYIA